MEYTVREVFREFSDKYLAKYKPSYEQRKVLNKILDCRTEKLGTRIYQCDKCGIKVFTYNSCKDRHCPSCLSYKKEVWIDSHKEDILDINYFHIVLEIPEELRPIFYHNQKSMYSLLFKTSSETIMELCDSYLGVKVGITSMLHTWSQKGNYFPHIHMVVTGGGIDKLGRWIDCKKEELLDKSIIVKKFRSNLIEEIKKVKELVCYGDYEYFKSRW